jgi:hypothetical protein
MPGDAGFKTQLLVLLTCSGQVWPHTPGMQEGQENRKSCWEWKALPIWPAGLLQRAQPQATRLHAQPRRACLVPFCSHQPSVGYCSWKARILKPSGNSAPCWCAVPQLERSFPTLATINSVTCYYTALAVIHFLMTSLYLGETENVSEWAILNRSCSKFINDVLSRYYMGSGSQTSAV